MSRISIENLTFGFDGAAENVFEDVTLTLDTNWKLGLIGRNGKGKTTLLRLVSGAYEYRGRIAASVGFEYFPFAVGDETATAYEVIQGVAPQTQQWQAERECDRLGVGAQTLSRSFQTLSGGERTKILLAALFLREQAFLLLDEPTNHLDAEGRAILSRYLASKRGFIVVSHDRAFLDGCTDHILAINRRSIELTAGNYSVWRGEKTVRNAAEAARNGKLEREIDRLETAQRRTAEWSDRAEASKIGHGPCDRGFIGHKAAKMMQRAKSVEKRRDRAVAEKKGLLTDVEEIEALAFFPIPCPKERLIACRAAEYAYPGGTAIRLDAVVNRGERVAIAGGNGSGKTTALKLLYGLLPPTRGIVERASGLEISYVPQTTDHLRGTPYDLAREYGVDRGRLFATLMRLGYARELFERDCAGYSEGQRKKLALALSLARPAHLYVWDEPLNYLDIDAREQLETLLTRAEASMIFVEHDAAFVAAVATRTMRISDPS